MSESKLLGAVGRPATDVEWAAIAGRRLTPRFTFVVTSTGIVCTPGCPARIPRRDRVRIVSGLDEGLTSGARPCLRCHPDGPFGVKSTPTDPVQSAVARLTAALEAGDEAPTDRALAGDLRIPERRLRELFRQSLGVTPRAWVAARRAEMLRSRLAGGRDVTSALYDAGYGSSSAAYEAASVELGMAPGQYRKGAAGESIRWTIAPIPEGVALVAATERGLCAVRLGDSAATLAVELRAEFPLAALCRDDAALADVASIVSDLATGRRRPEAETLPLDVHATAFRRRVWEALRRIPAGETRSYGQIAKAVGAPGAARAVGSACAANPVAVVVPCHRVIGSDGSLHGYAYGLARKRRLLDAEVVGEAAEATVEADAS
jgi:AraC family transcriptional regulator of adaptative response/methylated-DNA-[protein]-cysteine methyltransferase